MWWLLFNPKYQDQRLCTGNVGRDSIWSLVSFRNFHLSPPKQINRILSFRHPVGIGQIASMIPSYNKYPPAASTLRGVLASASWGMSHAWLPDGYLAKCG
jgi:hypothetical protein